MSADMRMRVRLSRAASARRLVLGSLVLLAGCSWFTDFKEQPKIDPWDSPSDTIPPRGNPQWSVPITGQSAPNLIYGRDQMASVEAMGATLHNPIVADSASVARGQKLFQINCAVCHGARGEGIGRVMKYASAPGMLAGAALGTGSMASNYPDGKIFAYIRNGKNMMPSYTRIEENERWDIINYIRALQGKIAIAADTTHGLPGETGTRVPGASMTAPTRPAPHYHTQASTGSAPPLTSPTPVPPGANVDSMLKKRRTDR